MTPNSQNTEKPFNRLHGKMKYVACEAGKRCGCSTPSYLWPWNVSAISCTLWTHSNHAFELYMYLVPWRTIFCWPLHLITGQNRTYRTSRKLLSHICSPHVHVHGGFIRMVNLLCLDNFNILWNKEVWYRLSESTHSLFSHLNLMSWGREKRIVKNTCFGGGYYCRHTLLTTCYRVIACLTQVSSLWAILFLLPWLKHSDSSIYGEQNFAL